MPHTIKFYTRQTPNPSSSLFLSNLALGCVLQYQVCEAYKLAPYISKYRINLTLGERQYANFKSNRKS